MKLTNEERDALQMQLAEGFHTAFRKASDHENADQIWKLIRGLPNPEWASIVGFVVDGVAPWMERDLIPAIIKRDTSSPKRKTSRRRSG